jgi:hypothetical protein
MSMGMVLDGETQLRVKVLIKKLLEAQKIGCGM